MPTRAEPVIMRRSIGPGASMAYAPCPDSLFAPYDPESGPEYGRRLEELSLRALPRLPRDCAFIRWDIMAPAWTGSGGEPLSPPMQEIRMNASTRHRRLRKAATELCSPDTMLVDLSGSPDELRARMDYRTRYSLRLAQRRGTVVERVGPDGLGSFHGLHSRSAPRHGLRVQPASTYRELFRAAEEHDLDLALYLARSGGQDAAAAIIARHGGEAWYLFAASSPEQRRAAGPTAVLHRALMDCRDAGDRRMDLLGVGPPLAKEHPLSGLTLFKSGFGGRRVGRAGAWDYVLDPEAHAEYASREILATG